MVPQMILQLFNLNQDTFPKKKKKTNLNQDRMGLDGGGPLA